MAEPTMAEKAKRPFCACGHSYYSHSIPRPLSEPPTLKCERIGCRCGEYAPEPDVSEEAD